MKNQRGGIVIIGTALAIIGLLAHVAQAVDFTLDTQIRMRADEAKAYKWHVCGATGIPIPFLQEEGGRVCVFSGSGKSTIVTLSVLTLGGELESMQRIVGDSGPTPPPKPDDPIPPPKPDDPVPPKPDPKPPSPAVPDDRFDNVGQLAMKTANALPPEVKAQAKQVAEAYRSTAAGFAAGRFPSFTAASAYLEEQLRLARGDRAKDWNPFSAAMKPVWAKHIVGLGTAREDIVDFYIALATGLEAVR